MITKAIGYTFTFLVCNVVGILSVSDLDNGYTYIKCITNTPNIGLNMDHVTIVNQPISECGIICSPYNVYASFWGTICNCGNITDAQYLTGTSLNCDQCPNDSNFECGSITNDYLSVYAKLEDTCAPHCAKCTVNECIECDAGSNFVNGVCEPPSNPCDTDDCSDVCTPDGSSFTCSCNAANRYLMADGKTCEDCSTNCLTCTDNTTCTACSTGYNLEASGNCVATPTNPNNMAASINGDPHVMIKNSNNNGDSFCFDITAHSGNDDNGIHIIQDTPLKVDGKLELCGNGMSCLAEVVIDYNGNTMKFVAKDDTNNTPAKLIVGGTEHQWDQQGSLTSGSITLNSVSGTDNVKLIKIDLSATDVVEMNVHQFGGSTFKYLGIIFKNNVFSSNLNGALGQYIGKSFTVNTNEDEVTFGPNGSPLSVSAVQRYNPASRTIEPCYLHANSKNDLVKTYLYDYS